MTDGDIQFWKVRQNSSSVLQERRCELQVEAELRVGQYLQSALKGVGPKQIAPFVRTILGGVPAHNVPYAPDMRGRRSMGVDQRGYIRRR